MLPRPPEVAVPPARHLDGALPDREQACRLLTQLIAAPPPPRLPADSGPVVLYGAGELGQMAAAWCRDFGVRIQGVVDAAAARWNGHPAWAAHRVLAPQEVPAQWRHEHRLLTCISTLPQVPLSAELRTQGWQEVQPFYDFADDWHTPRHPLNNGWRAPLPAGGPALAQLRAVLDGWDDAVSRAHHLQFLAWRCRRQEWSFDEAPVVPDERYFIAELAACWRPGERIVDGGAYHGQMLARWLRERPGWLARAWALEPDPANYGALRRWHAGLPPPLGGRIALHPLALGRRSGRRRFVTGQGYGSRLWPLGDHTVELRPLDAQPWSPTYVKLHLEGGEAAALAGAASTLARSRPLLALTVYHRRDGLWATAAYLMRTLPTYRWLFRLHGWLGTGAVIYGLPHERCA